MPIHTLEEILKIHHDDLTENDIQVLEKNALSDNKDAAFHLASYYDGIDENNKVLEYWKIAANNGHSTAAFHLADYYCNENDDAEEASKYCKRALEIDKENVDAKELLLRIMGRGDPSTVIELSGEEVLKLASEQENLGVGIS